MMFFGVGSEERDCRDACCCRQI